MSFQIMSMGRAVAGDTICSISESVRTKRTDEGMWTSVALPLHVFESLLAAQWR
jgi:hypothetical protein